MHSVFYLFFEFLLILFADFRSQSIFFQITVQETRLTSSIPASLLILPPADFQAAIKASLSYFQVFLKRPVTRKLDIIGFDDRSGSMEECLLDNSLQLFDITVQLQLVKRFSASGDKRFGCILCCADISARIWKR